jgi:hypothetical protein
VLSVSEDILVFCRVGDSRGNLLARHRGGLELRSQASLRAHALLCCSRTRRAAVALSRSLTSTTARHRPRKGSPMPVAAVAPGVCDVGEETPISTRGVDELWSEKRFLRAPLATGLDRGGARASASVCNRTHLERAMEQPASSGPCRFSLLSPCHAPSSIRVRAILRFPFSAGRVLFLREAVRPQTTRRGAQVGRPLGPEKPARVL